ncbi:MAG TPA: PEGA domain-containing protein [Myxococcota bacterium]|nr:PEGA domain-containing protein [Myxococcota bacterium]
MPIRMQACLFSFLAVLAIQPGLSAQELAPEPGVVSGQPADEAAPPAASSEPAAPADEAAPPEMVEPSAEAIDRARAFADQASALYDSGQFSEAIVQFNAALAIYEHPVIYFNLAKAYEKLAEYSPAAEAYRQYLALTLKTTGEPAPDQADTERTIELLKEKAYLALPEVSIDSEPRGADVFIDGSEALNGQTPMKTHLPEGKHSVTLKMDGYEPVSREFEVRSREPVRFSFGLVKVRNEGAILVKVNIRQARIHVDGRVVGATPLLEPLVVTPGRHQILIEREDYTSVSTVVDVKADETVEVEAELHLSRKSFSWRGGVGVSAIILGAGIVGASFWGRYYINDDYKGQGMYNVVSPNAQSAPDFKMYKSLVYAGYGVGAGLAALGIGMLIWEVARKPAEVRDQDLIGSRKPSIRFMPAFGPDSVGFGAVAAF